MGTGEYGEEGNLDNRFPFPCPHFLVHLASLVAACGDGSSGDRLSQQELACKECDVVYVTCWHGGTYARRWKRPRPPGLRRSNPGGEK